MNDDSRTEGRVTASRTAREQLDASATLYQFSRKETSLRRERLKASVRAAVAEGMSEVQAAKVAGVTRMTVRSWLGKH